MQVYFTYVRHGETLFNLVRRMQGQCDSPLFADGIAQAENTASDISDGMIRLQLSEAFRSYLSKLPLRFFEPQLLSIPAKRPYEFQLGYKLISNYYNRQAINQHHRDCLSVTTLIHNSSLPTREDVKKKKSLGVPQIRVV